MALLKSDGFEKPTQQLCHDYNDFYRLFQSQMVNDIITTEIYTPLIPYHFVK